MRHTAEAIRLLDIELERHPRYSDPRRLQRYAFQVCSQNGEDGIICEIFRRLGTTDRVFAEVGIGDGFREQHGVPAFPRLDGFLVRRQQHGPQDHRVSPT